MFWRDHYKFHGNFLDPQLLPDGSFEIRSVHPYVLLSFRLSVLPSVWLFSWNCIISFFFLILAWCHKTIWSCVGQSWIFLEKIFCLQNWENGPKMGQKQGFFNLLRNFFINLYWTHSIMKIYICCVPAKISYLGKFLFLRYCWNIGQNVLYCRIF